MRSVKALAQYFLIRDRILFGESLVWKCSIRSLGLTCSGVEMEAMLGSNRWYRLRQSDVWFVCVSKRLVIDVWSFRASTSIFDLKPNLALRIDVVVVIKKSGTAL